MTRILPLMDANSGNPLEASIARLRAQEAEGPPCCICGERGANAEMYDAAMLGEAELFGEAEAGICHDTCGVAAGWEVA
jgi:hypothetical protein